MFCVILIVQAWVTIKLLHPSTRALVTASASFDACYVYVTGPGTTQSLNKKKIHPTSPTAYTGDPPYEHHRRPTACTLTRSRASKCASLWSRRSALLTEERCRPRLRDSRYMDRLSRHRGRVMSSTLGAQHQHAIQRCQKLPSSSQGSRHHGGRPSGAKESENCGTRRPDQATRTLLLHLERHCKTVEQLHLPRAAR